VSGAKEALDVIEPPATATANWPVPSKAEKLPELRLVEALRVEVWPGNVVTVKTPAFALAVGYEALKADEVDN
jgi:hypothetical protein